MDIAYDENRGNPPEPKCLVSLARAEELYQATQDVWEWEVPADGDVNFMTLPIVRLEAVVKICQVESPVPNPMGGLLETCLHLFNFLEPALTALTERG